MSTIQNMKSALKDSGLKGGTGSVRDPVVGVLKRPKKRGKTTGTAQRDQVLQVQRVRKPKITRGEHWNDNNQVYLTGLDLNTHGPAHLRAGAFFAFLNSLIATTDPLDRAHNHRRLVDTEMPKHIDESWVLLNHDEIDHPLSKIGRRTGKPKKTTVRRYHHSQLTSSGVAFDSMHDQGYEIAKGIQSAGINLGWEITKSGDASMAEHDRAHVLAGLDCKQAAAVLEPRTNQSMTQEERALESAATAMLHKEQ